MKLTNIWVGLILIAGLAFGSGLLSTIPALAGEHNQIPTVAIPTVTGTPQGAIITVKNSGNQDQINVRSGPGTIGYDIVGVLVVSQTAPALGRTPGGDWIQIVYPGVPGGVAWVYAPLVDLAGTVPIVEAPPTPTPRVTPTIDPTLAAQFLIDIQPTRLPTYTPPPPISIPTFEPVNTLGSNSRLPMGFVIIGLTVLGLFGMLISVLRGR
jgi:hypothetical protein